MIFSSLARFAFVMILGFIVIDGVAMVHAQLPTAGPTQAAALHSYQIKFSFEKPDGKRKIMTIVVQSTSTTEAQRQVKDFYHKVNIITIKRL